MRPYARTVPFEGESVAQFLKGFRTEATKEGYSRKLQHFLEFAQVPPDEFLARTKQDPRWAEHMIIDYVEVRKQRVSGATIITIRDALKHFYEMNDYENGINWSKIVKMMPKARKVGSDRAPTVEEVRKMVDNADLRIKCLITFLASSGIRVGATEAITWGDFEPIIEAGQAVAARVTVYRGDPEEYRTYVSPECCNYLVEYKQRRAEIGEVITRDSPLFRDAWNTREGRRIRNDDPRMARPMSAFTARNVIRDLLWKIGMRNRVGRHEFKQVHGFRKFFKTQAERVMKTIDVEKLLGHTENYYKPSMEYLLQEYRKAVPYLTMSESVELKDQLKRLSDHNYTKVGELEQMNLVLLERVAIMEGQIKELNELLTVRKA